MFIVAVLLLNHAELAKLNLGINQIKKRGLDTDINKLHSKIPFDMTDSKRTRNENVHNITHPKIEDPLNYRRI